MTKPTHAEPRVSDTDTDPCAPRGTFWRDFDMRYRAGRELIQRITDRQDRLIYDRLAATNKPAVVRDLEAIIGLTHERDEARRERDEARADCDKMSHLHATLTDELARVKAELAKWVPATQTAKPRTGVVVDVEPGDTWTRINEIDTTIWQYRNNLCRDTHDKLGCGRWNRSHKWPSEHDITPAEARAQIEAWGHTWQEKAKESTAETFSRPAGDKPSPTQPPLKVGDVCRTDDEKRRVPVGATVRYDMHGHRERDYSVFRAYDGNVAFDHLRTDHDSACGNLGPWTILSLPDQPAPPPRAEAKRVMWYSGTDCHGKVYLYTSQTALAAHSVNAGPTISVEVVESST